MRVDVSLQRERFADWIGEAMPLIERHWHEVAHYKDIPLNVNRDGYIAAENADLVRLYTMRHAATRLLLGYALFLVSLNLHYCTSRQAKQDVLFIAPEHRGGFLGSRLVRFADDAMRAEGVQVSYQHVKLEHPALGSILQRIGYEPIEVIWGRRLDLPKGTGLLSGRSAALGGEDANTARAAELAAHERVNVEDEDAEHLDRREVV